MAASEEETTNEIMPYPFYHYRDHSRDENPDPLTPLTIAGRMPNFPAKLHAILSQPDFADIITWLPHGRSWLVLHPQQFESRILPIYFKTSKFSSFVRQANGWGFRRVMQGRDRNSYYHPKFLRFLPHLCKSMKRPAKSQKETLPTTNEPDFYKISEIYPIPDRPDAETIILKSTMQVGPHARMPILTRGPSSASCSSDQEQPEASATRQTTLVSSSSDKSGEQCAVHGNDVTLYSLRPFQISTTGSLKPIGATASANATTDDHSMQTDASTTTPSEAEPNRNASPVLMVQNHADNSIPSTVAAPPCFSPVKISSQVLPIGALNEVAKTACATDTANAIPEAASGAVTEDMVAPMLAFMPAPVTTAPAQSTAPKPQAMAIVLPCFPDMDASSMAQFAAGFAWATAHMQSMMKQATMTGGTPRGEEQQQQQGQPPAAASETSP